MGKNKAIMIVVKDNVIEKAHKILAECFNEANKNENSYDVVRRARSKILDMLIKSFEEGEAKTLVYGDGKIILDTLFRYWILSPQVAKTYLDENFKIQSSKEKKLLENSSEENKSFKSVFNLSSPYHITLLSYIFEKYSAGWFVYRQLRLDLEKDKLEHLHYHLSPSILQEFVRRKILTRRCLSEVPYRLDLYIKKGIYNKYERGSAKFNYEYALTQDAYKKFIALNRR
ncbi:hypothetical protein JDFR1000234_25 [uncultured archaeal virus]|uniref:Uncharacterized protein n=1 Tax=uncultured archaeal virus TaxID=1960247 RepID=A0A1S5Y361_9VIRU|nr:hypothetical protein JDFR1000234_25 [uncultured archaeal virus]